MAGLQQHIKPDEMKKYKQLLQRGDRSAMLSKLPELHEKAVAKHDCLTCAQCCKNYSPRFKTPDIKRLAKHLKMKESVFIDTYLTLDDEGDYVTRSLPCPFLGADNKCTVYDQRPSDCRRFPYTDEDVFLKRKNITLKNITFCPIAHDVMKGLADNV
ncbi:MAG: YkgJ family cysteine cluster protein [Chitinophagaceae bacterium]|nr:YkgJ family cysteine cluster protein [Chitinophagaceae bacterium]